MTSIKEFINIYNTHELKCSCGLCIIVRKWEQDIKQFENELTEEGKEE